MAEPGTTDSTCRKRPVPVVITLPSGAQRQGFHEPWRQMVVWKELAAADDLDELGEPEGWWWCHAYEGEVEFSPAPPIPNDVEVEDG